MYASKRHATVKYADGGSLSHTFADVGDFQMGTLNADQRELVAVMNRDDFSAWVEGPERPITFSFTINLKGEAVTSAASERAMDVIRWKGTWASATTTNPGGFGGKVGTLTYTLTVNGTTSVMPIRYAKLEANLAESTPTTIAVTGEGFLGTVTAS